MGQNDATKQMRPSDLANQLFDAALLQHKDPREAGRQLVVFLTEALVFAISGTTTKDEAGRRALFRSVGESIVALSQPTPAPPRGAP